MSNIAITPDDLHRGVKMALDTGEAETVAEGYALFERYRVNILVGPEIATSRAHQIALLTMVNAGQRTLLGGVYVVALPEVPLLVDVPDLGSSLSEAVLSLGGQLPEHPIKDSPTIVLGSVDLSSTLPGLHIIATFDGWRGGVGPSGSCERIPEHAGSVLGATLAGALAISEIFQNLRGYAVACRRVVGFSLWNPSSLDWQTQGGEPEIRAMPSRLWLMGLGHLGQAYLWVFGLFDYQNPSDVEITLQDFDRLTKSNVSTSVLTSSDRVGELKTRVMAEWAEGRGFKSRIVERKFDGDLGLTDADPQVALCGVDNLMARAAIDEGGFKLVVEAGLGAGPEEYVAARIHTFPASVTSKSKWGDAEHDRATGQGRAYDALLEAGAVDECGLVQLATRTVGAPFVGLVTACLVVAELARRIHGGPELEVVDLSLKTPRELMSVPSAKESRPWSHGFAKLREAYLKP
ncbi:hypothetical protein [Agrobacterium tumefaciens]|uniref:Thiamine biosynthesis protein ThiF n=1 Tax=Agrobacterium tumefaciens TaxID=358 RepID=A0A2L2LKT2_AGRTU|nr:hypothetical protein [Agrobacterium tumefaciens]AVH44952.1 hypothetical protein At1D1609_49120 [Agrobacterium tumefaciens]NSY98848.1 hypothetical protein [Agrobacterium tumefaciens]